MALRPESVRPSEDTMAHAASIGRALLSLGLSVMLGVVLLYPRPLLAWEPTRPVEFVIPAGKETIAFCRCGRSKNRPYNSAKCVRNEARRSFFGKVFATP